MTKLKAKGKLQKVFHDAQTLALVGFYINLRRQAIADFFFENKSQVLCKEKHGSLHPVISH